MLLLYLSQVKKKLKRSPRDTKLNVEGETKVTKVDTGCEVTECG